MQKRKVIIASLCIIYMMLFPATLFANKPYSLQECADTVMQADQASGQSFNVLQCTGITDLKGLELLQDIEYLEITSSNLTDLPSDFASLSKLKHLSLVNNNFNKIPEAIFSLKNLETLQLTNNQLSYISPNITKLLNLKVLNLSGNNLLTLPKEISNLANLEELQVSTNRLITMPNLSTMPKLSMLGLQNNQLIQVPAIDTTNITAISLNNNLFTDESIIIQDKFITVKSNVLQIYAEGAKVEVHDVWKNMSKDLMSMVKISDGTYPYGFSGYALTNVVDSENQPVNIEKYLDINSMQVKETGVVKARISLSVAEVGTAIQTADYVTINFSKTTIPRETSDNNTGTDNGAPFINESKTPEIPPIMGNQIQTNNESVTSQEASRVVFTPSLPPSNSLRTLVPQVLSKTAVNNNTLNLYEVVRYIVLNMALGILMVLPLIGFFIIFKRLKNISEKTDAVLYEEE